MNRFYSTLAMGFISLVFITGCSKNDDSSEKALQTTHGNMVNQGEISYSVDQAWIKEEPRSSMRKAQYRLPGQENGADAELGVFVFPGGGGGIQDNINRWVGQFKQPDGSSSTDKTDIKKIESNTLPVTLVYVTGTYMSGSMGGAMGGNAKDKAGFAMLAAIVETSSDPWFFKAVGPQTTIDYWRPAFESFAQTFKQN